MSLVGTALRATAAAGLALLSGFVPSEVIGWLRGSGRPGEGGPPPKPNAESEERDERRAVADLLDSLGRLEDPDILALKALWDDQPAELTICASPRAPGVAIEILAPRLQEPGTVQLT